MAQKVLAKQAAYLPFSFMILKLLLEGDARKRLECVRQQGTFLWQLRTQHQSPFSKFPHGFSKLQI